MGELRDALETTLDALELGPRDEAAAELARQLAEEIDNAHAAERVASKALEFIAEIDDRDPEVEELIRALKAKVSHRDAVVRVGQRLESVLVALQATPAARGKTSGSVLPAGGALAVLRGGAAG